MDFAEDIAQPGWPEPRSALIDFALTFLEADVMLFRSGYAKRHLARRLGQAPLTAADVARIEAVLRRATAGGAGLEEFRAYADLAARLVAEARLPGFEDWLVGRAEGAILTADRCDGRESRDIRRLAPLSEADLAGWQRLGGPGVVWPGLDRLVDAGRAAPRPGGQGAAQRLSGCCGRSGGGRAAGTAGWRRWRGPEARGAAIICVPRSGFAEESATCRLDRGELCDPIARRQCDPTIAASAPELPQ